MPNPTLTRDLAFAAALDAGNRAARIRYANDMSSGKPWTVDDYNACWATFDRLWPPCKDGWPASECPDCRAQQVA